MENQEERDDEEGQERDKNKEHRRGACGARRPGDRQWCAVGPSAHAQAHAHSEGSVSTGHPVLGGEREWEKYRQKDKGQRVAGGEVQHTILCACNTQLAVSQCEEQGGKEKHHIQTHASLERWKRVPHASV